MNRITPAPSFRPSTRTLTRTRNRTRPMSPSPRPNSRRSFIDPSAMFITTDYDYVQSSSVSDSDLIFNMSPVHSHFGPPSPPSHEPINVMTLCKKSPTKTTSPPLSPLLYTFPRPSRLHSPSQTKQAPFNHKDILSKPLSSLSQNMAAPKIDLLVRPPSTLFDDEVGDARPLADSFTESSLLRTQPDHASPPIKTPHSAHSSHHSSPSSPIPIPRHVPRQSDPGPFVSHPSPSDRDYLPRTYFDTPIPSSGIASHIAISEYRSSGQGATNATSPARSSASSDILRIEGFDGTDCDPTTTDQEKSGDESLAGMPSSAVSTSAYSQSSWGSGPFRFSKYMKLDEDVSSFGTKRTLDAHPTVRPKELSSRKGDRLGY